MASKRLQEYAINAIEGMRHINSYLLFIPRKNKIGIATIVAINIKLMTRLANNFKKSFIWLNLVCPVARVGGGR